MMYCKNCGKEVNQNADACVHCGVSVLKGKNYCANCGAETPKDADFCTKCGKATQNTQLEERERKSKLAAGLLALFLGYLGIHNFYLGYTGKAVAQLLLTFGALFTLGLSYLVCLVWALIEAIFIFSGKIKDADGNPLAD